MQTPSPIDVRAALSKTRAVLAIIAVTLSTMVAGAVTPASAAVEPYVMPQGHLNITVSDLEYILDQIQMAERHAARTVQPNGSTTSYPYNSAACLNNNDVRNITSWAFPGVGYTYDVRFPLGLRQVDAFCNNLGTGNSTWGAADQVFPRMVPRQLVSPYDNPVADPNFGGALVVHDSQVRTVSNLISDQTANNPAAVAASGTSGTETSINATSGASVPVLKVPNVTPDGGQSAPYNSWFTLFGQFFDHGLDLVPKGNNGYVSMDLLPGDTYYSTNPQNPNFMVLTRASQATGAAAGESINLTTPYVDQNQTYTSHPSHQVFLRDYRCGTTTSTGATCSTSALPVNTGLLFDSPQAAAGNGLPTWADVKAQAANKLGILLTDADVSNVPMIFTDQYGNFIPSAVNGTAGFPQVVFKDKNNTSVPYTGTYQLKSGTGASPLSLADYKQGGVVWTPVRTGHAFLDDIANGAAPVFDAKTGALVPDADTSVTSKTCATGVTKCYNDELLNVHYITGDGRGNENIGLTSVHQVFHGEHNTVVNDIKALLTSGSPDVSASFLAAWKPSDWNGKRLFQAARMVTEMEYQHLVFDEFARRFQPGLAAFNLYDTTMNAAIKAEFAHAVYRFGHSMLTETVARSVSDSVSGAVQDKSLGLIAGFLNPTSWTDAGTMNASQAAGAVAQGMTTQQGNEIDEFLTEALRNNLIGLPLDLASLNMARARETGVPTLNSFRTALYAQTGLPSLQPYSSWADFGFALRHPESLVNFIAAYGTDASITSETTTARKRAAAATLVAAQTTPGTAGYNFMWAQNGNTAASTGLNAVDLWIGGLAERPAKNLLVPAILGSTFDYVFTQQMLALQNGDRFYYLYRLAGTNLLQQIAGQSFARIIQRNTTATALPSPVFSTPDCTIRATGATSWNIFRSPNMPVCSSPVQAPDGTIIYTGSENVVMAAQPTVATKLQGGQQDDTLWGGTGDDTLNGGQGSDILDGGDGSDVIVDLEGADVINGGRGDDIINGGPGVDLINGGSGQDFMFGGDANGGKVHSGDTGDDFVSGGLAGDLLDGGNGTDWIEGLDGADVLDGDNAATAAVAWLTTGAGDDVIIGGPGTDAQNGDAGNDVLLAGNGFDTLNGGPGFDWASYEGAVDVVNANLARVPVAGTADTYQQVEAVSGSAKNDTIAGDQTVMTNADYASMTRAKATITGLGAILDPAIAAGVFIQGQASNLLLGGGGNDVMTGDRGNDVLDGDAYLHVCLLLSDTATALLPAAFVSANSVPCGSLNKPGFMSMTPLAQYMQSRTIKPSDLTIVREIKYDASGSDTVQFAGPSTAYTITRVANQPNCWIVTQSLAAGGVQDGTDYVCNFERMQFLGDGTSWYITGFASTTGGNTNSWNPQTLSTGATAGTMIMPATRIAGLTSLTVGASAASNTNPPRPGSTVGAAGGVVDPWVTTPTVVTYTWEVQDSTTRWVTAKGTQPPSETMTIGATDTHTITYVPVVADGAFPLRLKAQWQDANGMMKTLVSPATPAIVQGPVPASYDPTLFFDTTTATRGVSLQTYALTPGAIIDGNGVPTTAGAFRYQWQNRTTDTGTCTNVATASATFSSYIPDSTDFGKFLCVRVSFTDLSGNPEVVTAMFPTAVQAGSNKAGTLDLTKLITAGGPPLAGRAMTAAAVTNAGPTGGLIDTDGIPTTAASYTYAWYMSTDGKLAGCGGAALSSTANYTPQSADSGKYLCISVSYTDNMGMAELPMAVFSKPISVQTAATAAVLDLFGTTSATVGTPLTADPTKIVDLNGVPTTGFTYQWQRGSTQGACNTNISGATSASYTPVSVDYNTFLCLRVTFVDGYNTTENPVAQFASRVASGPNTPATETNTVFGPPATTVLRQGTSIAVSLSGGIPVGLSDADGLPASGYTYAWSRSASSACTSPTSVAGNVTSYLPALADVGSYLCLQISFTDVGGHAESPIVATARVIGELVTMTSGGADTAITGGQDLYQYAYVAGTMFTFSITNFDKAWDVIRLTGYKYTSADLTSGLIVVATSGSNTIITLYQPGTGKFKTPVQVGTITLVGVTGISATDASYFLFV